MSSAGAELAVTEEQLQGASEHEHMEDLSGAVPEVDVAEPMVGPPAADESRVAYFDEAEPEEEPAQAELPGIERLVDRS